MRDWRRVLRSFRYRNFRLYFVGQLVSMAGTWMQTMAQMWLVYRLTQSSFLLGLIGFAGQLPVLMVGLFGGVVADRYDRRRVLLWTQSAALVQALALGWLTCAGSVRTWHVFALSLALGFVNVFDMPARQALVVDLVDREDLGNAVALNSFIVNSTRMIGPAVAGLVVARWGEGADFLLNAASYLASVGTLAVLEIPSRTADASASLGEAWNQMKGGLDYAFSDARIRSMLLLLAALSLAGVPFMVLMPIFASDVLHRGAEGVGWLMGASGVGALGASWYLAQRRGMAGLSSTIAASAALFAAALLVFAGSSSMAVSLAAMAATGFGMITTFAGCNTLLQSLTSDEMRGRVMGLFGMTFMGVAPVGNLLSGVVAEKVGAPWTVGLGAALCLASAVWFSRQRWSEAEFSPSLRTMTAAALLLLAAASAPLRAQSASATERILTWEECVKLALGQNPDLSSARYATQAGVHNYRGSINGLLPGVTFTNSYSKTHPLSNPFGKSTTAPQQYTGSLAANVNLLSASSIAGVRSSAASLAQARSNEALTSSNVRFNLRKAYLQVLFAQKSGDVAQSIMDLRRRDSEMVTLRYRSGHEYKGNMMQSRAQYAQAQANYRQALRDLRSAQKSLDRQLGLDDFALFLATGDLASAAAPPLPADLSPSVSARPDVAVQQAVVGGARAGVAKAQSNFWPALAANYTRNRIDSVEFPNASYNWSVGATLSLPIFSGGPAATFEAVSAARNSLLQSEQDLRTTRDAAIADLESSWAGYADAFDQVSVQTELLDAARQRNAEADVRYASGLLAFENWELIVTQRVGAEQSALQAQLNAADAQANWDRALGRRLGEQP